MEASLSKRKDYCLTCGHVVAKERVALSSLEFRRLIHRIADYEELNSNKDRLYRYIKSSYRIKEFADQFLKDLEDKLDNENDLDIIKLWLLGFINNEDRAFPPKEIYLYKFLLRIYLMEENIDMTFGDFYDSYSHWVDDPMSKNRVSRALLVFGLKTSMKKIICEGKKKCSIMLSATKEELLELGRKNGFSLIPTA
jgi:hypothetical protein